MNKPKLQKHKAPATTQLSQTLGEIDEILFKGFDTWILGGSVRKILTGKDFGRSDYDVFFTSQEEFDRAREHLLKFVPTINISKHPNCHSFTLLDWQCKQMNIPRDGLYIQMIQRSYSHDVTEIMANFDFTACQFGYKDGEYFSSVEAWEHEQTQTLTLNQYKEHNEISPVRMLKYLQLGYAPNEEVFRKFFLEQGETIPEYGYDLSSSVELYGAI